MLDRFKSSFARDSQGNTLVETAVTLPIILILVTGIFSFSIALHQKLTLAEAVSAGERVLVADRGDTDPCNTTTSAIYAAAPTLTPSKLSITYKLNGVSVGSGVTTCSGTGNMVSGQPAEITATYPVSLAIYGRSFGTFYLTTQITENVQ